MSNRKKVHKLIVDQSTDPAAFFASRRRSLHSLRMVWKTMGPLQACELLLVIVSLPQGGTSKLIFSMTSF